MAKSPNRVTSFSVKPADKEGLTELDKLVRYSETTGISLSFLIISAIKKINKELKLK